MFDCTDITGKSMDNNVKNTHSSKSFDSISTRKRDDISFDGQCHWFKDSTDVSDIMYTDHPESSPTLSTLDKYQTTPEVPNLTSGITSENHGYPTAYNFTEWTGGPTITEINGYPTISDIDEDYGPEPTAVIPGEDHEYPPSYDFSEEDYEHPPSLSTPGGYPATESNANSPSYYYPDDYYEDELTLSTPGWYPTTASNEYPPNYDLSGEDDEDGTLFPEPTLWYTFCIAVDYTVVEFHGEKKLWPYFLNLLNMVSNYHVLYFKQRTVLHPSILLEEKIHKV